MARVLIFNFFEIVFKVSSLKPSFFTPIHLILYFLRLKENDYVDTYFNNGEDYNDDDGGGDDEGGTF